MTQFHSDHTRHIDPMAPPNAEVFFVGPEMQEPSDDDSPAIAGYYWRFLDNSNNPQGPFETEGDAIADANDYQGDSTE